MRRALPLAGMLIAGVLMLGAKGCNPSCADLTKALEVAKASGDTQAIAAAGWALAEAGCAIEAPPPATCPDGLPPGPDGCPKTCADLACQYGCTEAPTGAVCRPALPPDPCASVVCPAKEHCEGGACVADAPPPAASWCPKALAPGASIMLRPPKRYGNGLDTTLYVVGDPAFCEMINGIAGLAQCHLEGWPTRQACELELMGGCPTWRYRSGAEAGVCHDNRVGAAVSCDHFGSAGGGHDDPNTPTTGTTLETLQGFEGAPPVCGLQRDSLGPMAGPWTMPQCTKGRPCEVSACLPDGTGCSAYLTVDWR